MTRAALLLPLLLASCAPSGGEAVDDAGPRDLGEALADGAAVDAGPDRDEGPQPDADAAPDAAPGADAGPDPDASLDPDRGPNPDRGPPPDPCADAITRCGPPEVVRCVPQADAATCVCDAGDPRAALLAGVGDLDFDGALPSALVVHGAGAFPVVVDGAGRPVVAAAVVGAGRAFHVAHEGVMTRPGDDPTGFGRLVDNAVAWLTADRAEPVILVAPDFGGLADRLAADGWVIRRGGPDALAGADLFITTAYTESTPAQQANLDAFVAAGGGLMTGGHAWWWGRNGGDAPRDFPGNHTLRRVGITVLAETAEGGRYPLPARAAADLHQARCGLLALADAADGGAALAPEAEAVAALAAGGAVTALPTESPLFDAARALSEAVGPVIPTTAQPVDPQSDPLSALAVRVQVRLALDGPAEAVTAHPAAADFPGAVSPDAPRVGGEITYELRYPGYPERFIYSGAGADLWLPTGLYAAPGDVITITTPAAARGQGLGVQIGAHSDTLWHREQWERMPALVRRAPLDAAQTAIANGFGGPVYLTVPPGTDLGVVTFGVQGGVQMALYQHPGDPAGFLAGAAAGDAPWAELISGRVGMLLPTEVAADVADPAALMTFWDRVMDVSAELAGFSTARVRAERFVLDRQISAGWMHSGYPVMGHLPVAREISDLAALQVDGAWGPFHELGHNHQWADWVLPGTTETTCNLWSVRVSEAVAGIDRGRAHPALDPASRAGRIADWQANPNGRDWSVWTALETYLQLQEAFGWDWLPALFTEYRALPDVARPGDDAARIQQWVQRSSRAIGRDLTAFYAAWGFPIDAATRAAVADLPAWADHPMR